MNKKLIALAIAAVFTVLPTYSATLEERAQLEVATKMKDPSSVQFKDLKEFDNTAICGQVNGKNSYGGYVGFKPFILTPKSGGLILPSDGIPIEVLSSGVCKDGDFDSNWKNTFLVVKVLSAKAGIDALNKEYEKQKTIIESVLVGKSKDDRIYALQVGRDNLMEEKVKNLTTANNELAALDSVYNESRTPLTIKLVEEDLKIATNNLKNLLDKKEEFINSDRKNASYAKEYVAELVISAAKEQATIKVLEARLVVLKGVK